MGAKEVKTRYGGKEVRMVTEAGIRYWWGGGAQKARQGGVYR